MEATWVILFEYVEAQSLDNIIEDHGAFEISDLKHYMTHLILAPIPPTEQTSSIETSNQHILISATAAPRCPESDDFGVSKFRMGESMTISDTPVEPSPTCPDVYAKEARGFLCC